ncbi:MAG: transposase [Candidatus Liptonbacteria bacterium]|nr:transposase [Candidatus Liptonbacteria bacterium]
MRKEKFINGKIYHVLNRGAGQCNIFLDDEDYLRFIHDLYEFNDEVPASNIYYRQTKSYDVGNRKVRPNRNRKCIVDILVFSLMNNHFHFLIRQKQDNGIQIFMKKLGTGYANYFNNKNKRVGVLFQGRFKAIPVQSDQHLLHLPYYIHLNSLDLYEPGWRKREIRNYKKVMEFLENYRWSSLPDYLGIKNFPSVINKNFLTELIGKPIEYKKSLISWLKDFNLDNIDDTILE